MVAESQRGNPYDSP